MRLELDRSVVRPWQKSDADALTRHANARSIWLNLRDGFPHPYTRADAESFLESAPSTYWCIEVGGEAAGGIGLSRGEDVERYAAELGYWLGEAHWGQGIVSEAVASVTDYAFAELGVHRMFALPYAHNRASARVLEKSGYTLEAQLRDASFKDGAFVDQLLYARVQTDDVPCPRHALTILAVDDLADATSFYGAVLGWQRVVEVPVYVEFRHRAGQRLGLYTREAYDQTVGASSRGVDGDNATGTELYFHVHDLDAAMQRAVRAGAVETSARALRPWGDEAVYYRDPLGNVLVLAMAK